MDLGYCKSIKIAILPGDMRQSLYTEEFLPHAWPARGLLINDSEEVYTKNLFDELSYNCKLDHCLAEMRTYEYNEYVTEVKEELQLR